MPRINLIVFNKSSSGILVWVADQKGWDDSYSLDQYVRVNAGGTIITGVPQGTQPLLVFPTINSAIAFAGVGVGPAIIQYRQNTADAWIDAPITVPSDETPRQGAGTLGRFNVKNRGNLRFLKPATNSVGAGIGGVEVADANTEWFLESISGNLYKLVHVTL